jgi:hypothetical protein
MIACVGAPGPEGGSRTSMRAERIEDDHLGLLLLKR